jgi:hypothetical protein
VIKPSNNPNINVEMARATRTLAVLPPVLGRLVFPMASVTSPQYLTSIRKSSQNGPHKVEQDNRMHYRGFSNGGSFRIVRNVPAHFKVEKYVVRKSLPPVKSGSVSQIYTSERVDDFSNFAYKFQSIQFNMRVNLI